MKRALLALLLASCSPTSDGTPTCQEWSKPWLGWAGSCFSGVKSDGSFTFPTRPECHVDYVMKSNLERPKSIAVTIGQASFFTYQDDHLKDCYHGPTVRIEIAANVQGLSGRFWQKTGIPVTPGVHVIAINYNPSLWSDVNGQTATELPVNAAVGYAFGDDCAFGHGVYADKPASFSQTGF